MIAQPDSIQLLTSKQLAEALGIHVRTIHRRVARTMMGEDDFPLPLRLSDRAIRWRRADVAEWLRSREGGGCT